jgi:protein-disulfide isomerase
MRQSARIIAVAVLLIGVCRPLWAEQASAGALSAAQKQEVEAAVREFILRNPEVLVESLTAYDTARRKAAESNAAAAVAQNRDVLETGQHSPFAGNPKGDVTVVEFFDYRCGYCKRALPAMQELLKTDPGVRYVFKELPILGPESVVASRAALAVWTLAPERYLPFHIALMEARGGLTDARVVEIAKAQGIDVDRMKQVMASAEIDGAIRQTRDLAAKLGIQGTPAFVVGGKLVPGLVDLATLRELVAAARAG